MSEKKDVKWEMPQAVFKSSEGSLPKSLEETISQSFIANAETLEIDEDDDILGIMDPAMISQPMQKSEEAEAEDILETEPAAKADAADDKPIVPIIEEEPATEIPDAAEIKETQPIAVTAKKSHDTSATVSGSSGSNLFIFVVIALMAVVAAGLYYYFSQNK